MSYTPQKFNELIAQYPQHSEVKSLKYLHNLITQGITRISSPRPYSTLMNALLSEDFHKFLAGDELLKINGKDCKLTRDQVVTKYAYFAIYEECGSPYNFHRKQMSQFSTPRKSKLKTD